ncbi:MAG: alpha/beta hydrolase [Litorimonas sp.]
MYYANPTYVSVDGFRIATYPHGPRDGTPIVLIHGWPELAYSWDTTVPALVEAGYRVVAYDLLGFGRSDAPRQPTHYGIANLVAHLEAVLDHYGMETAVLCGHDWGGIVLWHAVRILKARTLAAIGISTPHVGLAPADPMKIFEKRFGKDHYFLAFRDHPDRVDALFSSDPDAFFRMMFRTTPKGTVLTPELSHTPKRFRDYLDAGAPPSQGMVVTPEQLAIYVEMYERTGFLPGMNYYRNTTANWTFAQGLSERIEVPALMLSPEDDFFLPPSSTDGMVRTVPDLTRVVIPDCGHWAMWDQPDAVNAAMLDWLSARGF